MGFPVKEAVSSCRIDFYTGPEAGGNRTPRTTDTVDPEGVQGVVVTEIVLADGDGCIADDAANGADINGRQGSDEAGGRRNGSEAGNAAGGGTENRRFAIDDPFDENPRNRSCCCGTLGGNERTGCQGVGT